MKTNLDKHIQTDMNKEQELPASIRQAFDKSYDQIRQQAKKKPRKSWLKPVSAAVAVLALSTTILVTNDTALAKLQAFFGLNDPGIENALEQGDVHSVPQVQVSEGVAITLEHLFVDAYRFGLQVDIQSEHIHDDLYYLDFEFRLYDAQGQEISAHVSDTKPIAGPGVFSGGKYVLGDVANNRATLEFLTEAHTTSIPSLEGAKFVIETVHFLNSEGGQTSIDGNWSFDVMPTTILTETFVAKNTVPGLELLEASLSNGSMKVTYKTDNVIDNENDFFETALVTANGEAFYANSASPHYLEEENQTIVNLVFPYSIWSEEKTLSLKVKGYEALELVQK